MTNVATVQKASEDPRLSVHGTEFVLKVGCDGKAGEPWCVTPYGISRETLQSLADSIYKAGVIPTALMDEPEPTDDGVDESDE